MDFSSSSRILATPGAFAKNNFLYVQEVGSLQSVSPHISRRDNLKSYLFFVVTKGKGTLTYHGQTFPLHTGDCVFLDCLKEYSHESSMEEPWELSWVHFYGKQAPLLYGHFLELGGSFLFHPLHLSIFLDTLSILFETQKNPGNSSAFLSHRYLTDLVALCISEIGNTAEGSVFEKINEIQQYLLYQQISSVTGIQKKDRKHHRQLSDRASGVPCQKAAPVFKSSSGCHRRRMWLCRCRIFCQSI